MKQIMIRLSDEEKAALDMAVAKAGARIGVPISQATWVRRAIVVRIDAEKKRSADNEM